jgi:hypothetical protein
MTFEFGIVKLLDSCAKVCHGLVLNKTTAVALAADFGVDNVQTGLACKVL